MRLSPGEKPPVRTRIPWSDGTPTEASGTTVFVSYSRADQRRARSIIDTLEKAGYSVWWDGLLAPGERFANSTEAALESARAVVVLWSATSIASHWVHDEATRARDRGVLVPLSLDGSKPPLGFGQFQTISIGARGAARDAGIDAMLASVAALHEGAAPGANTPVATAATAPLSRRAALAGGAVALAAVAGGGAWIGGLFGEKRQANSVAVLPFLNLSGEAESDYFTDGLAAEVRSQLAAEPLLAVAAQTSSNKFRGSDADAASISRDLGVAYLLDGTVRRAGDRVRVSAELLEGKRGLSRWSETFDRKLDDVFSVQAEIADAVVAALTSQMARSGVTGATRSPGGTTSFAAYDAFLQGLDLYDRASDRSGDQLALAAFEKAISLDPGYAQARAMRARSLTVFGNQYDHGPARRARYEEAIAEARKATQLAPELAEAQSALGFALFSGTVDAKAAREPFAKSYQFGRGDADVLSRFALYEARCGRFTVARPAIRRAAELDPLNARAFRQVGEVEYCAREWAASIPPVQKALSLNPDMSVAHAAIAFSQIMLGDLAAAARELEQEKSGLFRHTGLAILALRQDREQDAERHRAALVAENGDNSFYQQAEVLAQWGKLPDALAMLEMAHRTADSGLIYLRNDPFVDPLRKEPRFIALSEALGFV